MLDPSISVAALLNELLTSSSYKELPIQVSSLQIFAMASIS